MDCHNIKQLHADRLMTPINIKIMYVYHKIFEGNMYI